ncbi:MAG: hypothetical protein WCF16_13470 [Alphaproteobacteria bacterium]
MKKVLLSVFATAFLLGVGAATFPTHSAFAADAPKVDCTKKENKDKAECKKK